MAFKNLLVHIDDGKACTLIRADFPVPPRKFPDTPIEFPVPILREFMANLLI